MCLQTLLVMHEFGQLRKAGQPGEENVSVHQHEKKKKKDFPTLLHKFGPPASL